MRLASFLNLLFRFIRDISNKKTLYESVVYNISPRTIKQYIHPLRYRIDEIFPIKYRKDTLRNTKRVQMNINFTPLCEWRCTARRFARCSQ